jgi:DNA helicase II / ATP-dependent DNA helicase PcrA
MDFLDGLNPQQRMAVTAPPGPVLVLAGPGSGKTRVLIHRAAYLVRHAGAPPRSLLAVTFTNKAAREMQTRLANLLADAHGAGLPSLGTFHAACARILRREADRLPVTRDFVIFDDADQEALLRQVLKELNLDPRQHPPGRIHAAISSAKNELILPEAYPASSYVAEIVRRAYGRYDQLLRENNAFDFDDLLVWAGRLLRDNDDVRERYRRLYQHILVDEFQDTNTAQYELLRLLAPNEPDLFLVGDPDQSIYRWRGADYRNVQRFQKDYPNHRVFLLEQNYRSTQHILDAAMAVIDRHPDRQKKRLFTDRGQGPQIVLRETYDEQEEAAYVVETIAALTLQQQLEPRECAVMYRTNAQSRALEEAFLHANLPYRLVGAQRFYGRREVKDLIAYLRLVHNPADQVSLLRVLNTPPRGLGAKSIEAMLESAARSQQTPGVYLLDLGRGTAEAPSALSARAAGGLASFGQQLSAWRERAASLPVAELIDVLLGSVRYREFIDDGTEEGEDRWANVLELRGLAQDYTDLGLSEFLQQVALVSDQDTLTETLNAPVLLTLHAAKGLEFRSVFVIGLDEGLLPHQRSFDDREAMAEERRLFYVGITRAQDFLFLVRAFRRHSFGTGGVCEPSRFLSDIPADLLAGDEGRRGPTRAQALYERQTRWESSADAPAEPRYRAGMHVQHSAFGDGIVMESHLDREDETVTIAFGQAGVKRLSASLARLEVLDD